jgi:hypothetical protein
MGRLRVLACLPLAALAIACGSGDDKPAKPKATASRADDMRVAKDATLKLKDFPPGWKGEPSSEDRTSKCARVEETKKLVSARATSDSFSQGQTTLAENAIYVFPDEDTAKKGFQLVSGTDSQDCYARIVVQAFASQPGVKVGTPRATHPEMESVGDEHSATRVAVKLSSKQVGVDVVVDLVIVRTGRGISLSLYVNLQEPFDEALRVKLTSATVERLHDGLT